jgi:adenylate kinase
MGKCDLDGSELFQREDDTGDTVSRRIRVYMDQTSPLIEYYRADGKLVEIDATQPIEVVTAALEAAIGK